MQDFKNIQESKIEIKKKKKKRIKKKKKYIKRKEFPKKTSV